MESKKRKENGEESKESTDIKKLKQSSLEAKKPSKIQLKLSTTISV